MTVPSQSVKTEPAANRAMAVLRAMASLKLAVVLILVLAAVLAWATFLESAKGREYAQWYVYKSFWFIGLLALLSSNILASALLRFPWRKSRRGFLVTHAGLLVLFFGAVQTFLHGIDGQLVFEEGQAVDSILLGDRCQFTALWRGQQGAAPMAFIFQPGPRDWPARKTLDLGELGGVRLKVLRFLRHARVEERWVADQADRGGPALRFALAGPDGKPIVENWLAAEQFGAEVSLGPTKVQLQQAKTPSVLEDFLRPPGKDMDKQGVLSMHYEGRMVRIPVSENVGKKTGVGDSKISVQIAEYLPNARPDAEARFTSQGEEPGNPMLELRIHVPDAKEPMRQIAFARHPLLNLDGIHGGNCPVKFWYHHPAVTPEPGVEFLQTPDGKLHGRSVVEGECRARDEVRAGDRIEMAAGFQIAILDYLPHARKAVTFHPVQAGSDETAGPEPAALVEIAAGGALQEVWLHRNDETYGFRQVGTPKGPLAIALGYERLPLGFSLELLDFQRGTNPGSMGDASFASSVRLVDPHARVDQKWLISMNQPLVHGQYTFYQSGFQETPDGREASTLTAAYDPGRFAKYLGSLMICWGCFLLFFSKAFSWGRLRFPILRRAGAADQDLQAGAVAQEASRPHKDVPQHNLAASTAQAE